MTGILQDLRYASRRLVKAPGFAVLTVLTLGIGIASNTSVFALVDAMLFKPAPWNRGDQLVWVASLNPRSGRVGSLSYPDYLVYRDRATTLSGVLAYGGGGMSVGGSRPERVLGGVVSGNYFDVLGIPAAIGRTFRPDEDTDPGANPVVVLSDAFWTNHFGADRTVVNSTVAINGRPFRIVGIAPPGFTGVTYADDPEQLWVPLAMQSVAMPASPGLLKAANIGWLRIVGRLREGVTVARADAEMRLIAGQVTSAGTPAGREKSARVTPVRGGMSPWEQSELGPMFGLISVVPLLVLLVACANVANVLMARDVSRRKEMAMRLAIGASRGRLIRQLVTEALLLALLAAATGFALSFGLTALIEHYGDVPADFSSLVAPGIRALLATTALAIVTTVLFGLVPALTAAHVDLLPSLKDEGATSTARSGRTRLRRVFVVAQVALSLTMLIAAGLFLESLAKTMRVDPGFEPKGVVTVSFDPDLQGYTAARRDAFTEQFLDRVSSLSGVNSAAVTSRLPLSGEMYEAAVISDSTKAAVRATYASISPRYFETLRLPLMLGRDFSATDTAGALPVVIVNETLARALWPAGDPIGKRLRVADATQPWLDVVGVVRDAKYLSLTESARGAYYGSVRQGTDSPLSMVVRSAGTPSAVLEAITRVARDLDRDLPLFRAETLEDSLRQTVRLRRATTSLLNVLGGLTLLLAAIGVYGVAAHGASVRTREVGIRMALGARAMDVSRLLVHESLSLSLIGIGIGLGLSLAASRLLTSFLFGLAPTDLRTFLGASTILCAVALLASYLPARRAARVDPLVALRYE